MVERREPRDSESLFRLYADVFGQPATEASQRRWRWQYLENPALTGPPEIWVARQGEELLGQYASMPVRLRWGADEVRASWGMDVFVRAEARGQGVGAALFSAWADHVDVALGLGLTEASHGLFRKLRYQDVGPVPFYLKVLDPVAVARRRLGPTLGALAGPILGPALRLITARPPRPPADVTVAKVTAFGDDYDRLWDRLAPSYTMCVRRDRPYLAWKYTACPHHTYDILEARRSGDLVGFSIVRTADVGEVRLGWIVDLFTDPKDEATQDALLAAGADSFRRAAAARVQCFAMNGAVARALTRHGFLRRPSPMQFCVRSRVPADAVFARPDAWHVVFGDSDMDR